MVPIKTPNYPSRRSVLLICQDHMGDSMAGPAIRYHELASRLSNRWDVTLLAMQRPGSGWEPEEYSLEVRDPLTWRSLKSIAGRFDVVLTQPLRLQLTDALRASGTPVVIDAYVPNLLEQATAQSGGDPRLERALDLQIQRAALELRGACRIGTTFLYAGDSYREFLLGVLATEGRLGRRLLQVDPSASTLLVRAPFGLSLHDRPERNLPTTPLRTELGIADDDKVFVWAGGIWDWLDPITPIRGLAHAVRSAGKDDPVRRAKIVFLGVDHPNPQVQTTSLRRIQDVVQEEGLGKQVFIRRGWVPYNQRGSLLADADVGICAHHDSLETRFSWRQRLMDHIWAGLPTLCTEGDELGRIICGAGGGTAIPADDIVGWSRSLRESCASLVSDGNNALDALAQTLSWESIVGDVNNALELSASDSNVAKESSSSPRMMLPRYVKVQIARMGLMTAMKKSVRSLARN